MSSRKGWALGYWLQTKLGIGVRWTDLFNRLGPVGRFLAEMWRGGADAQWDAAPEWLRDPLSYDQQQAADHDTRP